jgi:hypothetical protein
MPRTRHLSALVVVILVLAGASSAHAGQYTVTYDFGAQSDLSGWSGYVEPGYNLCGHGATAGCPDVSTNRIMARAGSGQAIWSQGRWEWTAPPGTTIVGGSLAYRTRMRHSQFYARVKMRSAGDWADAPTLLAEQQTTTLTDHVIALASGFRQVGISLYAHPAVAGLVTDAWDDYVTLVRMDVTVSDANPPGVGWMDGGSLLDGAWHRSDVCATVAVGDNESGISGVWLASDGITSSWSAPRTGSQYQPGITWGQANLCLSAAALGDGVHAGSVGGSDVSGEVAAGLPFTVRIDRTPPAVGVLAPGAIADSPRPPLELAFSDALSGTASVAVQVDGVGLPVSFPSPGRATARPAAPLSFGAHTLSWSAVDAAGNRTDGSTSFSVPDTTPPAFGPPDPAAGSSIGSGDVLSVSVAVTDDGSGIDPASIDLRLDGTPVEHLWRTGDVVHGVVARRLAAGVHHLVLQVADRAANVARLAWDVTVAAVDATPASTAPVSAGAPAGAPSAGGAGSAGGGAGARPARVRAASVRALVTRIGSTRARVVVVRLRARPHLRIALRVRCAQLVKTLRLRANARGIATARVACSGAATVRLASVPGRVLVRIAARRLPLRLMVVPEGRAAPTVARVSGRLAELRGRTLELEALTATGWHRVGRAHVDAAGGFVTSFAIVRAGQFALRARVPAVAGAASAPVVLTMR